MNFLFNCLLQVCLRLFAEQKGNVAAIVGVLAVPIMLSAGSAVDYTRLNSARASLQSVTDAAALTAAREFRVSSSSIEVIKEVAKTYVQTYEPGVEVEVKVDEETREVEVLLAKYWEPMLIHHVIDEALPIRTSAKAGNAGSGVLCVLALHDSATGSLRIEGQGSIDAQGCAIHSNSSDHKGIALDPKSLLHAESICSSGGYAGTDKLVEPQPLVDCPPIEDPLTKRRFPVNTFCDFDETTISGDKITLHPGTYCGDVHITSRSNVALLPGHYQFLKATLTVDGHSTISGKNITLQFSGSGASLDLTNSSKVSFSAKTSGTTAGILILADKTIDPDAVIKIQSFDAKEFTGMIYAPNNKVEIGSDTDRGDICATGGIHGPKCKHMPPFCLTLFGEFSDWTAVVAKSVEVNDGVHLVLHTNFADSDVPLPSGMSSIGNRSRLLN